MQIGPIEGAVPTEAVLDLEFRFAPSVGLSARELEEKVVEYLTEVAGKALDETFSLEIEIVPGSGEGYRFAKPDDPLVQTLVRSYETVGVDLPLSISCFGSVPEGYTFVKELGIPFMCGGVGRGGNFHAPDEWIIKDDYPRFKLWFAEFLDEFARSYSS